MSLAAILALINSVVSAAATMAKAAIDMVPWSNPITWCVLAFVGGCEYGRHSVVEQVNEQRKQEERPAIIHPFRPWLGVSEAEGGEIQPKQLEPVIDDSDYIAEPPQAIEAVEVSESKCDHSPPACSPQGCGLRAVRQPVRKAIQRLFRR